MYKTKANAGGSLEKFAVFAKSLIISRQFSPKHNESNDFCEHEMFRRIFQKCKFRQKLNFAKRRFLF